MRDDAEPAGAARGDGSTDDTGRVRRLTAPGLVRRSRDAMDRRTAVPGPTEAGVALIGDVVASAGRA